MLIYFICRNRLESNSEHWNALLLSLRELTEWVIRKDTELTTLGMTPLRGDAAGLQKQLVSDFEITFFLGSFLSYLVNGKDVVHSFGSEIRSTTLVCKFDPQNMLNLITLI